MIGGFPEEWGTYTDKKACHGNMTSTDTLGIAPNAKLFDIRIFEKERIEESFLDVVIEAYDWAIQQLRRNGTPQLMGGIGAVPEVTDNSNRHISIIFSR